MAATAAAGCNLRLHHPLPAPSASRPAVPRPAALVNATARGASKLSVRATAAPSAGKQQPAASAGPAQSQFSYEPAQHASLSHGARGSKDSAVRAMQSTSVIEPPTDVTSPNVDGNGAANGGSVNSSKQQLTELEILPSFVPHELTAAADISGALLDLEFSFLLSLPALEPTTSPRRQEPDAEEAEERENGSSDAAAEVADLEKVEEEKEKEETESSMARPGYSKRLESCGDQFFESDLRPVVLFDGVCNLCNKWVNFLLDYDPLGNLRFASLQGDSGKALLRRAGRDENDHADIVLVAHNKAYFGSDAILEIFSRLKPPFPLLAAAGHITPHALHDFIYKTVSESRYTLFGKADACRLFDPRFGQRFLPSELSNE
ncbi:hypothetical protein CLOM_g14309 [Closterium sp. NIES-68]|nr:hypothetical protein CLOM_g14309 [Closterium sp. NIES-68]GJP61707.1 hypothetical protein CLOP_g18851 [Closterium sp. NIES-67]